MGGPVLLETLYVEHRPSLDSFADGVVRVDLGAGHGYGVLDPCAPHCNAIVFTEMDQLDRLCWDYYSPPTRLSDSIPVLKTYAKLC